LSRTIAEKATLAVLALCFAIFQPILIVLVGIALIVLGLLDRSQFRNTIIASGVALFLIPNFVSVSRLGKYSVLNATFVQPHPFTESSVLASKVQRIFDDVERAYGYRSKVGTWGNVPTLFFPNEAWIHLSQKDRSTLVKHMQQHPVCQIIVGGIKDSRTIYVDRQVAGNAPKQSPEGKSNSSRTSSTHYGLQKIEKNWQRAQAPPRN
jgi:hypothetical protein